MDGRTGKQADRKIERDIYIYRERERYMHKILVDVRLNWLLGMQLGAPNSSKFEILDQN